MYIFEGIASTFHRPDSPFIWIRHKDAAGKWKSTNSGYRKDNIGDRKQAELLAKKKSLEEMANKPVRAGNRWQDWAVPWIKARWGNRTNRTPKMYVNYFWRWLEYFKFPPPNFSECRHCRMYWFWVANCMRR